MTTAQNLAEQESLSEQEALKGPAYTDADEGLRRYRDNPSPTPAPARDERLQEVEVTKEHVVFHLKDGRYVGVPLDWSWRLMEATEEERQDFEVGTYAVHWPAVDEDLSGRGALRGIPAPRPRSDSSDSPRTPRPKPDDEAPASWTAPRIKQLRRRLGLTQEEMGERMGVRQATISDWERANQDPSPMACRLLDALQDTLSG